MSVNKVNVKTDPEVNEGNITLILREPLGDSPYYALPLARLNKHTLQNIKEKTCRGCIKSITISVRLNLSSFDYTYMVKHLNVPADKAIMFALNTAKSEASLNESFDAYDVLERAEIRAQG